MLQHEDYLQAATILWGDAGRFAVTEYQRINDDIYGGDLPPLPIVIGLIPYGTCLAWTAKGSAATGPLPRITLPPEIFRGSNRTIGGANHVRDVLIHEMLHAQLQLHGCDPSHNGQPWSNWIRVLSPKVLGQYVQAAPVKPRRIDGKVMRRPLDGHLTRDQLASWPYSLRPAGWDHGPRIDVDTA